MRNRLLLLGVDLIIAALLLLGIWYDAYLRPQHGLPAAAFPLLTSTGEPVQQNSTLQQTNYLPASTNWKEKFSDTIIQTADTYRSPNLSITITKHTIDSNQTDASEQGNHLKYGTKISYTVADVYIGDITCFQTVFAKDTYGVGYKEKLTDMAQRSNAILSVNGDSYNNNRHQDNGTIIRNGSIYRSAATDMETCVLNWDGTMKIYTPEKLNTQSLCS